ncbi:UDP-N-acetylmuramoyl-L-alanyl-D-glutamate--2,6-diaminopimelate ligase [Ramlibacter sp.]|uniref:UDP-N-acetylmuramoyl-L-alanyl-D-glutamate--2, 6-diaminopimelate ligase n=1 Tax=Ramlibacter sp. TaxID=1917967 RepID=UPI002FC61CB6
MRQLRTPAEAARWLRGRVRGQLQCDSRRVRPGDGFIAWPGAAADGRQHVPAALAQGAAACLVEREGAEPFAFRDEAIAGYAQLKAATGPIAAEYYDHPSAQLQVLAVTGTNGKTSSAWWLAQALSRLPGDPWPCAVIGTLGSGRPPQLESSGLTTPDAVLLQAQFRRFADQGLKACAIEASSIGLQERRLDGTQVAVALFTNFTQDHLDYHGSMEAYWAAKEQLFRWRGLRAAVINVDDGKGAALAGELQGSRLELWTVSAERTARLQAVDIRHDAEGLQFAVLEAGERHSLATALVGQYNVTNLLGVIAAMRALGVPLADAVRACDGLAPVPGRMERLQQPGQPLVAVDYAHTPDALDKALLALRPLAMQRGGRLWCVFGCGGGRDPGKRPLMAAVAEKNADRVVVTSDNPRGEKPETIISQILLGLSHHDSVEVQADRALAIAQAVAAAAPADVILLAGKGHEDYQEVAGVRHPFDDREHARAALARRAGRGVAA